MKLQIFLSTINGTAFIFVTQKSNDVKSQAEKSVMFGFNPDIQKTQGTGSRYARRKQRASTKVRAAADVAVKLVTACHSRAWHGNL